MKEKIPFAITVPGTFQSCVWVPVLLLPDMYCSPTWKTILHVFLMYVSQFPASLLIRHCSFWMRKKSIWDSSDGRRSFGDIIFSLFWKSRIPLSVHSSIWKIRKSSIRMNLWSRQQLSWCWMRTILRKVRNIGTWLSWQRNVPRNGWFRTTFPLRLWKN